MPFVSIKTATMLPPEDPLLLDNEGGRTQIAPFPENSLLQVHQNDAFPSALPSGTCAKSRICGHRSRQPSQVPSQTCAKWLDAPFIPSSLAWFSDAWRLRDPTKWIPKVEKRKNLAFSLPRVGEFADSNAALH